WGVTTLSDMPKEPRQDTEHLPGPIMSVLKERVRPWGQAWVAGSSEAGPKPLPVQLALAQLGEQDRQLVSKLRIFAVWLDLGEQRTLHTTLSFVDAAAAETAAQILASRFRKDGKPDPRLKLVRKDEWVTLQFSLGNDTSAMR